ncbi:MAG: transposase [Candidatus Schekmanbacteria bacterium RBG_13_48_7]|uniref:Transposase n=1 Tax=Candidatus Schekmanbacteria bacterium RBG_13_48_7 TaxID=1817878 RepID=A0A1F7S936_9BACT|nr:MAG: transposase [Candidatus Schekmanbacteria bacterium RBG_13_48_7]
MAKAIQLIKGSSSKWVHDTFTNYQDFNWQKGYGAFSVSITHIKRTVAYINTQKTHHKTQTFQEEYIAFLKKHNIEYDKQHLWD